MKNKSILTIILLFFFTGYCFSQSGWFNQPLPINANSYDMKFFDANTGIISLENYYVLRTTNGGQNWNISQRIRIFEMEKINDSVLFGTGRKYNGYEVMYRTYNRGLSWDSVAESLDNVYGGLSFLNKDTGWICGFNGSYPVIWVTFNGGNIFTPQANNYGQDRIFFLKYKVNNQYYGWSSYGNSMYKTTNSGVNWFLVGPAGNLKQLNMIDTSTGWASNGSVNILKTTNGGLNWVNLPMPTGNNILFSNIDRFKIINSNKIYGVGGNRWFSGSGKITGIIWLTTNGGQTWGFQQPDTSFPYVAYDAIDFIDSTKGWCNNLHTTDGGGAITKVKIENAILPNRYYLKQNYPNPFNPQTTIEVSIIKNSYVTMKIFDITGKEVLRIYNNEVLNTGNYKVILDFNKGNLSSGIYFCRLNIWDNNYLRLFTDTKKMMYVK